MFHPLLHRGIDGRGAGGRERSRIDQRAQDSNGGRGKGECTPTDALVLVDQKPRKFLPRPDHQGKVHLKRLRHGESPLKKVSYEMHGRAGRAMTEGARHHVECG